MALSEGIATARYVVDAEGNKTDVILTLAEWKKLLSVLRLLIESLEDQEDGALLAEWLEKRASGEAQTISLEALEEELFEDGLLSG